MENLMDLFFVLCSFALIGTVISLLALLVKRLRKKDIKKCKIVFLSLLFSFALFTLSFFTVAFIKTDVDIKADIEKAANEADTTYEYEFSYNVSESSDYSSGAYGGYMLEDYGFTDKEIKQYEKIMDYLGLTIVSPETVIENGKMHVMQAKIYSSDNMQLNVTFENHKVIYVGLTGIIEEYEIWSNRKDKLTLYGGLQGQSSVDMYSDTQGGVLAVLDWYNKSLTKVK